MNEYTSPYEKTLNMAVEIRFKLYELGYPTEYADKVKELIDSYAKPVTPPPTNGNQVGGMK